MAKTPRRSVSVSRSTFDAFQAVCHARNQSVSGKVERMMVAEVARAIGDAPVPAPSLSPRSKTIRETLRRTTEQWLAEQARARAATERADRAERQLEALRAQAIMWESRARELGWHGDGSPGETTIYSQHFTF